MSYLSFRNVSFRYPNGKEVLHKVNFDLERGKPMRLLAPQAGVKQLQHHSLQDYMMPQGEQYC